MRYLLTLIIIFSAIIGCSGPKDDAKQDPGATSVKQPVDQELMQKIRAAKKSGIK